CKPTAPPMHRHRPLPRHRPRPRCSRDCSADVCACHLQRRALRNHHPVLHPPIHIRPHRHRPHPRPRERHRPARHRVHLGTERLRPRHPLPVHIAVRPTRAHREQPHDRTTTRLTSSHASTSHALSCLQPSRQRRPHFAADVTPSSVPTVRRPHLPTPPLAPYTPLFRSPTGTGPIPARGNVTVPLVTVFTWALNVCVPVTHCQST